MLHNICKIHGDTFDEEWLEGVEAVGEADTAETGSQSVSGESIRRALMAYFQHLSLKIETNSRISSLALLFFVSHPVLLPSSSAMLLSCIFFDTSVSSGTIKLLLDVCISPDRAVTSASDHELISGSFTRTEYRVYTYS